MRNRSHTQGRTKCSFSSNSDLPSTCETGGCNGGLICDPNTGTGVPPATLAEFTLSGGAVDWYDVSNVDGFNLPIQIDNTAGCNVANCPVDLNANCMLYDDLVILGSQVLLRSHGAQIPT